MGNKKLLFTSGYNFDNIDEFYTEFGKLEKEGEIKDSTDKKKVMLVK